MALPQNPSLGSLFNYDTATGPEGFLPPAKQPNGPGTPVTDPVQSTGEILGQFGSGCGHSFNSWEIASAAISGVRVAVIRCPLCQYVQRIISPYDAIYDPANEFIIA